MSDRLFVSYMRKLMRVEAQLDKERSYRYVDTARIIALKKLRLQLKDKLHVLLMKGMAARKEGVKAAKANHKLKQALRIAGAKRKRFNHTQPA